MHEYQFTVSCSPCCIETVKGAFRSCKNEITQDNYMQVSLQNNLATVRINQIKLKDTEVRKRLRAAVEERGFECRNIKKENHLLWGILGVISGAGLMGLCLSGIALPFLAWVGIALCSTILTLILGKNIFVRAAHNIKNLVQRKEKTLSMEVLLTLGSVITLGLSFGSFFVPWLPMMFDTALLILGFTHLGKALKQSKNSQVEEKLDFLSRPNSTIKAWDAQSKRFKIMKIAELQPGQIIRIYAGQTIPVDGICLSKTAAVCKINETGDKNKAWPVETGHPLQAGWEVPQGQHHIDIRVKKAEAQSRLAKLNKKYRFAQARKHEARKKQPFEKIAGLMIHYFVPCVLGFAIIAAIVTGILVSPLSAFQAVATIVASACPCTLGLIIPLAIKTALVKAAADGIRIKTEESFQQLSEVDTVIFDWNGTLTTGQPKVVYTNLQDKDLDYLAALEGQSNHHFAQAICEHIKKRRKSGPALLVSHLISHHSGLMASIQTQNSAEEKSPSENIKYLAGNANYLAEQGIKIDDDQQQKINIKKERTHAQDVTYFVRQHVDGTHKAYKILGYVLLSDPLRPDASKVIHELKKQKYKVGIISGGSNDERLSAFAREHNIDSDYVRDNCLSSVKEKFIAELKQDGHKIMMIGDSANDVLAMSKSDFSIAIKSKNVHGLTEQTADAVIDPENPSHQTKPLHSILNALHLAKQTVRSIKSI